jgi:uncharacterized protein involved in exopolysaccharide biosynthesis/uncharacterized protein (DUF433 family)
MNRLTRFAVRLYPKAWRERYGVEFAALLDELQPDLRGSLDIVKGALQMRATHWNLGAILAVSGLLGAVVAFGISFSIPKKYVSSAVIRITPGQSESVPGAAIDQAVGDHINSMSQAIFSRTVLTTIVFRMGLYQTERSQMPIEDVIELMRKNISVTPVASVPVASQRIPAFAVGFTYSDRFAAQRVTQELVSRYMDENIRQHEVGVAFPITLVMLDPASLPQNPVSPKRPLITTMGLTLGLALGAVAAFVRHVNRPMLPATGILEKNPAGRAVFRGTDVPVLTLLEYLEDDKTLDQFLKDFPEVTREAAVSALGLAKSFLAR